MFTVDIKMNDLTRKSEFIMDVKPENYFILSNGVIIKNLVELDTLLQTIEDSVFTSHLNEQKNDFASWIGNSIGDTLLSNNLKNVKNKAEVLELIHKRIQELTPQSTMPEMSPDVPVEDELLTTEKHTPTLAKQESNSSNDDLPIDIPPELPVDILDKQGLKLPPDVPMNMPDQEAVPTRIQKSANIPVEPVKTIKSDDEVKNIKNLNNVDKTEKVDTPQEVVEIRETENLHFGLKELDAIFPHGIPKISNILFIGKLNSEKTLTAFRLLISAAKKGEKTIYISFYASEEKIINNLRIIDKDIMNYINTGNIMIETIDSFQTAIQHTADNNSGFEFVKKVNPGLVVIDSLSALELSYCENKLGYRQYIFNIFKFFEREGIRAVFIKDLLNEKDLHIEFYESILADCILYFFHHKGKPNIKIIKNCFIPSVNIKKGLFSFLKK